MTVFTPGTIVRCREREWIVVPSKERELLLLRPLAGGEKEICGIYLPLRTDPVENATFPLPDPATCGDFVSASLLRDAARLTLRSGAGPFRSLGRISVYPRPYQIVPLLMALRQEYVRLLISDDVGIGKTIESALIARELLDRGEAHRLAVVCPPQLCDQWQKELSDKFHIDAVVIRSGTAARLERNVPPGDSSLFSYYPYMVVSVDYVKSDRRRESFLLHCPDPVIVDEAHTCARPPGQSAAQQQRHYLIRRIAEKKERHLILVTATPHSGIEESFLSILELLHPDFSTFDLSRISEEERTRLATYFIQRRRGDVKKWLGEETPFPERKSLEEAYHLSKDYQNFFDNVYEFAHEMVKTTETISGWRQRVRYWAALALLRCVMSSPAAAEAALREKAGLGGTLLELEEDELALTREVYDLTEEETTSDNQPSYLIEQGETTLSDPEKKRLRQFISEAQKLRGEKDQKSIKAVEIVDNLLKEGYHPIVYCRYIASAKYLAEELKDRLEAKHDDLRIIAVTGELPDEDREQRVEELSDSPRRVLVATDCLSEGVNLQEKFNAVVHYDLPWNPNRLEQREGRVDRFNQKSSKVKAVVLYGSNNPIDGAVLEVLIRKAVRIHRTLGISVPLPVNSETVMESVLKALFMRSKKAQQLTLFEMGDEVAEIHKIWDRAAERERESRTRFAQKGIKPEEVEKELKETNAALGDAEIVEQFVRSSCERLGAPLEKVKDCWKLNLSALPQPVQEKLHFQSDGRGRSSSYKISFKAQPPEGVIPVGRNHPLVESLASYLLENSLDPTEGSPVASRSGVMRTDAVSRRTSILLLRMRFLLEPQDSDSPLLAEEVLLHGFQGSGESPEELSEEELFKLISEAKPTATMTPEEKSRYIEEALEAYKALNSKIEKVAQERAIKLAQSHQRVRSAVKSKPVTVKPQLPLDLLGIYLLLPVPKGVRG